MSGAFELREVSVSQTPIQRFEEFLRSRGKRITQPRRAIVDEVFRRHEHFDAEELLLRLRESGSDRQASRPTVYRTLRELADAGLLREVTLHDRRTVYEHDYGYPQHDHLHCQQCNQLIEFHSEDLVRLRDAVARQWNFRVTGHKLIILGVCEQCQQARLRKARRLDRV